ncbi:MAG: alpha/beta hydrolase [bacterium]|nr:alpha/beta hydrolase [bacterium]
MTLVEAMPQQTESIEKEFPHEEAVVFQSNGETLFGIIHTPARERFTRRVGLILIPAGLQYRIGPCRLYVNLARQLSEEGLHVLRFDTHGIGDSGGDLGEKYVLDLWGSIEEGLFVQDTLAAVDFFVRQNRLDTVLVGGLCGGAITALICATRTDKVNGLVLLGLPILKDSHAAQNSLTDDMNLCYYGREIGSFGAWGRFLSGRSEYLSIFRALMHMLRNKRSDPLMNQVFLTSLKKVSGSPALMLLIYGERDKYRSDFEDRFWRNKEYRALKRRLRPHAEIHVVKGVDHAFSAPAWQIVLAHLISEWALRNFERPSPDRRTNSLIFR